MPDLDRRLTRREYVHLHNRAGFGLRPGELPRRERDVPTLGTAVSKLLDVGEIEELPMPQARLDEMGAVWYAIRGDWIRRMSRPGPRALLERMSLFWHDHFACLPIRENIALDYLNLIRREGLGNFGDLMSGMATDTAMMRYLDAVYITKANPNENFAREILELFTVGLEGYTEADVEALARSLAGWGMDSEENFIIRRDQVDTSVKTLLGRTAAMTGPEAITYVATHPSTARHLTSKLWTYLTDEEPDEALLQRLSAVLTDADFEMRPWLRAVLTADEFYADHLIGAKVKSPIDLLVMWTRHVGADLPDDHDKWVNFGRFNGQFLFFPPSVAGWPGGKAWVNSATIGFRLALPIRASGTPYANLNDADSYVGLAGYTREAVRALADDSQSGSADLALRMLGVEASGLDALSLAKHSKYQYA